jgi:hypothetical protein
MKNWTRCFESCLCGALWTGKSPPFRHFQEEQRKKGASSRNSKNNDYHKGTSFERIPFFVCNLDLPRFLSAKATPANNG